MPVEATQAAEPTSRHLTDRVALVTGAARGIGLAVARRLAAEGAQVVLSDLDEEAVRRAAADVPGASARALDVRDESAWDAAAGAIGREHGRLDVVVNNAGITGFDEVDDTEAGPPSPHDPEHVAVGAWESVLRTNLLGTMLGCRAALRAMRALGTPAGSIVNVGSRSGVVGTPRAAAYAASKAAVRNHTKTVALYCCEAPLPIRCNVVQPAAILTPMWEPMLGDGPGREERMAALVADCPMRRFGTPDEVAALVAWLVSDESSYVTGAEFTIDGGMLAGTAQRPKPVGD